MLGLILPYYKSFCSKMDGTNCHIGCSDSVLLTSMINDHVEENNYTYANYLYNGKMVYQFESNFLYYSLIRWTISHTIGSIDDEEIIMKTSTCPQEGGEFVDEEQISGGRLVNVQTTRECSVLCHNRPDCKFWQWNNR